MPNIESAIKRNRQSLKVSAHNKQQVSTMRTAKKKFLAAVEAGSDDVQALYEKAAQEIDRTASKGLIHKNKASRDKSRLASKVAK